MKKTTREWVEKAEGDYGTAKDLQQGDKRRYDSITFHCQQAAEKYLKSLQEELGIGVPRTHDLDVLLQSLHSHCPGLRRFRRGLLFLATFAVEVRYPGKKASKRQAESAIRWIERIRLEARKLLGLRATP